MKLSIIVPMYNVELYIEKCLLSCISQDIPTSDYEIIVINDGSPDGSLAIAERIASLYDNITIVSQENAGLSAARNTGLSLAKGKYVWFVDSDDSIQENCLKYIVQECYNKDLDLLALCAASVAENNLIRRFSYSEKFVCKGVELMINNKIQHCAPFTIYRRQFLVDNNIKFYEGIYHEDSEWSPRVYYHAKKVGFTNEILYFVTINPNSITRTANPKKGFDCIMVAESLDNFYNTTAKGECSIFFHNYISLMLNNGLSNFLTKVENATSFSEKEFRIVLYKKRHLFMNLRNSSILKYKIEGYLFSLFPKYALDLYRLMQVVNKYF